MVTAGCTNCDSVDFYVAVECYNKAGAAVDGAVLNQVSAVRLNLDGDIGSLNIEGSGVVYIAYEEGSIIACVLLIVSIEFFHLVIRDTA